MTVAEGSPYRWVVVVVNTPTEGADALGGEDWRFLRAPLDLRKPGLGLWLTKTTDRAYLFTLERACFEAGVVCGRGGWASVRMIEDEFDFAASSLVSGSEALRAAPPGRSRAARRAAPPSPRPVTRGESQ